MLSVGWHQYLVVCGFAPPLGPLPRWASAGTTPPKCCSPAGPAPPECCSPAGSGPLRPFSRYDGHSRLKRRASKRRRRMHVSAVPSSGPLSQRSKRR
eukprot:8270729-Heterocapsa_arctica.AAC.1